MRHVGVGSLVDESANGEVKFVRGVICLHRRDRIGAEGFGRYDARDMFAFTEGGFPQTLGVEAAFAEHVEQVPQFPLVFSARFENAMQRFVVCHFIQNLGNVTRDGTNATEGEQGAQRKNDRGLMSIT